MSQKGVFPSLSEKRGRLPIVQVLDAGGRLKTVQQSFVQALEDAQNKNYFKGTSTSHIQILKIHQNK